MMRPTVIQAIRIKPVTVVRSVRWAAEHEALDRQEAETR